MPSQRAGRGGASAARAGRRDRRRRLTGPCPALLAYPRAAAPRASDHPAQSRTSSEAVREAAPVRPAGERTQQPDHASRRRRPGKKITGARTRAGTARAAGRRRARAPAGPEPGERHRGAAAHRGRSADPLRRPAGAPATAEGAALPCLAMTRSIVGELTIPIPRVVPSCRLPRQAVALDLLVEVRARHLERTRGLRDIPVVLTELLIRKPSPPPA